MTCHRQAGSVEAALLQALHCLSDDEIRNVTGKTRRYFYDISNPNNGRSLELIDAGGLDAALIARGQRPLFLELLQEITAARLNGARGEAYDVERGLRRLVIEMGELGKAVDEAMVDGKWTAPERRRVASEAQDVIDHASLIRDAAEPPFEEMAGVAPLREAGE